VNSSYFIIEGDEYDSAFFEKFPKFLQYSPQILIINNIEFDHADIYSSLDEIKKQFKYLLRLVPENGIIIANGDDENVKEICESAYSPVIFYGQNKENDFRFKINEEQNIFHLNIYKNSRFEISIPMSFPLEGMGYNMTAAYIAALNAEVEKKELENSFASFKGVKRRLEKIFENRNYIVYDDFAHHPTAVNTTLNAVKKRYPDRHLTAVFEPRSNTSIRNIFLKEYKEALQNADSIYLAPAFKKSSVESGEYLNVEEITDFLSLQGKIAKTAEDYKILFEKCSTSLPENSVIVLMSNGSFEPFKSSFINFLQGDKKL
ncbi:MAG: hypothetical protein KAR38_05800, partial [Calditrichia bacterium]|nr:hypothetical protein [Calditrichia bacterium]